MLLVQRNRHPIGGLSKQLNYIDGLRALAVASVLFYHAGFNVPGGYVGVDVFFVISGFLISRIVYAQIDAGTFSLSTFYIRRVRRIAPALIAVTATTSVAASVILQPVELVNFAKAVIATTLLLPNVFYFAVTGDYFSPDAAELPLLHYWSLGVEEQFYVLFPLIALLSSHRRFVVVLGALLGSLIAAQIALASNPSAGFFLPGARACELLLGCLISLHREHSRIYPAIGAIAATLGMGCIVCAVFVYNDEILFPGLAAMLPAGGAALVLWGCLQRDNIVSIGLGAFPLVYVGRISYSLYLVHWPIVFFAARLFPDADPTTRGSLVVLLSTVLAAGSYEFIEQSFRQNLRLWTPPRLVLATGISAIAIFAFGGFVVRSDGFSRELEGSAQALESFKYDYKPHFREGSCFLKTDQRGNEFDAVACLPGSSERPKAFVWGDSSAAGIFLGISRVLTDAGYVTGQLTAAGCPPVVDYSSGKRRYCREFNDIAFARIVAELPDLVIVSAMGWPLDEDGEALTRATLDRLRSVGIKVVILGPPPMYRNPVPSLLIKRARKGDVSPLSGRDLDPKCSVLDGELRTRAKNWGVNYVSIIDHFCSFGQCPMMIDGIPAAWDKFHWTAPASISAARSVVPRILGGGS
ncbi:acyltransferase family protein [Hyphomicrobium sp. LHD-15]|uniref:acyltransferase family protein n=1 Tax=Hyphomicrobium sp. LHD-15 TaxID=3072142 RepID=UPI00280DCA7D|nr:acyltransferase family protein [Hyphomicrobium sp. LHD-15]MDQ8698827.1 acyltransferase family protein [Hyphomicrobium sp. LHD-15]